MGLIPPSPSPKLRRPGGFGGEEPWVAVFRVAFARTCVIGCAGAEPRKTIIMKGMKL